MGTIDSISSGVPTMTVRANDLPFGMDTLFPLVSDFAGGPAFCHMAVKAGVHITLRLRVLQRSRGRFWRRSRRRQWEFALDFFLTLTGHMTGQTVFTSFNFVRNPRGVFSYWLMAQQTYFIGSPCVVLRVLRRTQHPIFMAGTAILTEFKDMGYYRETVTGQGRFMTAGTGTVAPVGVIFRELR
jgi:hypothetical protein